MARDNAGVVELDRRAQDIAASEHGSYRLGLQQAIREGGRAKPPAKVDEGAALGQRAAQLQAELGGTYRQAVLLASEELSGRRRVRPTTSQGSNVDLDRDAQVLMSERANQGQPITYRTAVRLASAAAVGRS